MKRKLQKFVVLTICFLAIGVFMAGCAGKDGQGKGQTDEGSINKQEDTKDKAGKDVQEVLSSGVDIEDGKIEDKEAAKQKSLKEAERLAMGYDYDLALEKIKEIEGYEEDTECKEAIKNIEAEKEKAVPYENLDEITHIFFHTLIVDTDRAFDEDYTSSGYNLVMTTVDEFKKILRQMYDKGYVLVRIHDIAHIEKDSDGKEVMKKGEIYLPEGKKPFVLSQDDVCYYEYMENDGFACRLFIDEDGKPSCEYKDADGNVNYGAYDLVPILEEFIEEHPDFSYRGARGILALTGYNGVFGYRTDTAYENTNPNYQADIEEAKKTAQGLRDAGWELASHSWGHLNLGQVSYDRFKTDTDKWEKRVESIIGDTDIIIYSFGDDIGSWYPYDHDNERYNYLYEKGFRYFCNVDSTQYWVQITDEYLRQGRRNLDGQRMYEDLSGKADRLSDLMDVESVFDPARPTPVE